MIVALSAGAIILVFAVEFRPGRGAISKLQEHCAVELPGSCVDQKDFFASYGLIVPRGIETPLSDLFPTVAATAACRDAMCK